ncbi:unnamed protein product, partial [Staurois parvus]
RWSPPDSCLPGGAHLTPVCRGGAQNPGPDSLKRPAHTCAISLLAIPKTWSQDWRFHPSQISLKSPSSRSQKQTLQTKESEKALSSVSYIYPGAPQPALLRILGD